MAGIGFELRKVIVRGNLTQTFQAVLSGVFIVAGPWLLTIVTFFVLGQFFSSSVSEAPGLFQASIVYCYAISLVAFSPIHYFFTRLTADLIWEEKKKQAAWYLAAFTVATTAISAALAAYPALTIGIGSVSHEASFRWAWIALFSTLNGLWLVMLFVSLLKWYGRILFVYAFGMACALFFIGQWGSQGVAGALWGMTLGHAVILVGLSALCFWAYVPEKPISAWKLAVASLKKNGWLILCGFFFYCGQWVDKIYFWIARGAPVDQSALRLFESYDVAVYLANLTIVPGLVYFVIFSETNFAQSVNYFLNALVGQTYSEIQQRKYQMIAILKSELVRQSAFQFLVTLTVTLFAYFYFRTTGWQTLVVQTGVFFQLAFMTLLTFLFYLELYRDAAISSAVFLATAVVGCVFHSAYQDLIVGAGYAFAGVVASSFAFRTLLARLRVIDRLLFLRL